VVAFVTMWSVFQNTMAQHEMHLASMICVLVVYLSLLFVSFLNIPQMCYKLGKLSQSVEVVSLSSAAVFMLPIVCVLLAFIRVVINHVYLFFRLN
jgi:hypothetical protein